MARTINVDGVAYVPLDTGAVQLQLVVLHRGFVFVGHVDRSGDVIVIRKAKNIRRWGTKTGLGQLAADGPQPSTVLDDAGTVRYSPLAEVCCYDCDPTFWPE